MEDCESKRASCPTAMSGSVMPSRIPIAQAARCCQAGISLSRLSRPSRPPTSFVAAVSAQTRSASILANLSDNRSAYHKRIRKGRGPSSGYGKTSGRGHKGQKQKGKINPWFQGGQTPLIVSHGRKGFENKFAGEMSVVNLDKLQLWIDTGRIQAERPITPRELIRSGLVGSIKDGIKLLTGTRAGSGRGLRTAIDITVSRASAAAIAAVEAAGGRILTRFYTRDALRRLLRGQSVHSKEPLPVGAGHVEAVLGRAKTRPHLLRLPDPTGRTDIEYYRDPAHRGYLSGRLQKGESPSLYFRVPSLKAKVVKEKKAEVVQADERLF